MRTRKCEVPLWDGFVDEVSRTLPPAPPLKLISSQGSLSSWISNPPLPAGEVRVQVVGTTGPGVQTPALLTVCVRRSVTVTVVASGVKVVVSLTVTAAGVEVKVSVSRTVIGARVEVEVSVSMTVTGTGVKVWTVVTVSVRRSRVILSVVVLVRVAGLGRIVMILVEGTTVLVLVTVLVLKTLLVVTTHLVETGHQPFLWGAAAASATAAAARAREASTVNFMAK
ncbi:hypothetical protein BZA05DRAFT_385784 [Tricharina praecox]|uniref:uncharacterized protein n=1 Tax=Tricharina praecox TaxID=43433 RepID=UPI00221F36B0|nr:uncharacterized protein BZA05DRAFT_385784 [Tricharina praecox]KAI5858059.1 hypothetical protein BZA05DRAFT_385784 [Tricharina praecox]